MVRHGRHLSLPHATDGVRAIIRAERLKLYPSATQAAALAQYAGARRWLYNWGLAARQEAWQGRQETLTYYGQMRAITVLGRQPETAWLMAIPRRIKEGAMRDLDRAFKAFFRRIKAGEKPGYPRFRVHGKHETFAVMPDTRFRLVMIGDEPSGYGRIDVPHLPGLRCRGGYLSRLEDARLCGATFTLDRTGVWWASLIWELPDPAPLPFDTDAAIGVHLQLANVMSLSTGERIERAPPDARDERRLKRLQRAVSRKQRGSANREKARIALARESQRQANRRLHGIRQIAHDLVAAHPSIVVQERNTKALIEEPESKVARWDGRKRTARIHDAAWTTLAAQIVHNAERGGTPAIVVSAVAPSARTCNACGTVVPILPLSAREWICAHCGAANDRGINAARNVRGFGLGGATH